MQRKGMQATLLCAFTLVSGSFRRPDPGRQCATRLLAPMRLHWTAARTHTSPSVARSHERAARTSTHARMVMSSNDLQVHAMYRKAYLAGPFPVVCTKRFVTCRHDMCEKVVRLTSSFAVRCCFRRSQWCVPLVQQLTCAVRACVRERAGSIRQAGGAHEAPMPQATDVLPAGLRPNLHRTVRGFPQQARTFLLVHTCPQACDGPSHASDAWLARSVRACS